MPRHQAAGRGKFRMRRREGGGRRRVDGGKARADTMRFYRIYQKKLFTGRRGGGGERGERGEREDVVFLHIPGKNTS